MSEFLWSIVGFFFSPTGMSLIAHLILFTMWAIPIGIIWLFVHHVRRQRAFAATPIPPPNVTVLVPKAKSQFISDECAVNACATCTRAWCCCRCH